MLLVQVAMGGPNRKRRGGKEAKARRALKRAAGRANGGVPSVNGGAGDGDVGGSQPVDDVHVGSVAQPGSASLCDEIAAAELYEKVLAARERAAAWAGASASAAVAAAALVIPGFDEEEKAAEAAELEEDAQAELAELAFSLGSMKTTTLLTWRRRQETSWCREPPVAAWDRNRWFLYWLLPRQTMRHMIQEALHSPQRWCRGHVTAFTCTTSMT